MPRHCLTSMGIPIIKRWLWDHLISIMEIPILGRMFFIYWNRAQDVDRKANSLCYGFESPDIEYATSNMFVLLFLFCCGYIINFYEFIWCIYPYHSGLLHQQQGNEALLLTCKKKKNTTDTPCSWWLRLPNWFLVFFYSFISSSLSESMKHYLPVHP